MREKETKKSPPQKKRKKTTQKKGGGKVIYNNLRKGTGQQRENMLNDCPGEIPCSRGRGSSPWPSGVTTRRPKTCAGTII